MAPNSVPSFWAIALMHYWTNHRVNEPAQYYSVKGILDVLHRATGLTIAELAARLGIKTNQLNTLETNGEPLRVDMCEKLQRFAKEYGFPVMYRWLDGERLIRQQGLRDKRKRGTLDLSE